MVRYLLALVLLPVGQLLAQQQQRGARFLSVENMNTLTRFRLYPGDYIQLRYAGENWKLRGEITHLRNDTLWIDDGSEALNVVPLARVGWVKINERRGFATAVRWAGRFALTLGGTILLLRGVNAPIVGDYPVYPVGTQWAIGSLLGGGSVALLLTGGGYRVGPNRKWQVKILDLGS